MTNRIPDGGAGRITVSGPLSRRAFTAGAGALMGSLAVAGATQAQSNPRPSQPNPFPQAGPTPESSVGSERLLELLSFVPRDMLDRLAASGVHWYYADLAQQFDALGVPRDDDGPDPDHENWLNAQLALMAASNVFQFAMDRELTAAIGFDPLAVDQSLLAGDPPDQLTLFRGAFDRPGLVAAWEGSGYRLMESRAGTSFHSIGTDGEFELTHPIQSRMFAAFNNMTLIGDTLVCAPTLELLEAALAARAGDTSSVVEDAVFGPLVAALPGTAVSAMALTPEAVGIAAPPDPSQGAVADDLISQSDAAVGQMPIYQGLVTAVAAGAVANEAGDGAGTAMIRIMAGSAAEAKAVTDVVAYRWSEGRSLYTNQPYTDLMRITGLSTNGAVAMIDFEQLRSPRVWSDLFFRRDTLPFASRAPG